MSNVVSGPNHHDFNQSQIDFTNNTWTEFCSFQHGHRKQAILCGKPSKEDRSERFRPGHWAVADPRARTVTDSRHPVNEIKLILYFCGDYEKHMQWTDELELNWVQLWLNDRIGDKRF